MSTAFHSNYWAHALNLQQAVGSPDSLVRSISTAKVDLNPHQVDAAIYALKSPFSKGVILADEVGLGKTIEAGIVIAQKWAERKRKILLILPATLRKQWQQELQEKFGIPSLIIEGSSYKKLQTQGNPRPLDTGNDERVVICSYHFASSKKLDIKSIPWDLVVIDEAHRLRNVYKKKSKIAQNIKEALVDRHKLLLTATPLQNNLLELYGLVSIIDEHVFGGQKAFQEQFVALGNEERRNTLLRDRLEPICKRTLRRQVLEYINFTSRLPLTQEFTPTDDEQALYDEVSGYLQRKTLYALPNAQRQLMTLVLRKLLASSSFAIAGTLESLVDRLEKLKNNTLKEYDLASFSDDYDSLEELIDEWREDIDPSEQVTLQPHELLELEEELKELRTYLSRAKSIRYNAKGAALIQVLDRAFKQLSTLGAKRKAVIFTESRRTQQYLYDLLSEQGFENEIVMINGSNNDPKSRQIYADWKAMHANSDKLSGSRTADMKAAIVSEFRDNATLLIATESAAEGVNLQFSSLVINYDLPWNPQRVEQRIGRCHRYGQKHDVVVVNFLNKKNKADQRVFELLSIKFKLFDGVFGSSDEILGTLGSGVDLEKRIAEIYQQSRTAEEIKLAFDQLQSEVEDQIENQMEQTRTRLLENVDEEVSTRLGQYKDEANKSLDQYQQWLKKLTEYELGVKATFDTKEPTFDFSGRTYNFDWRKAEASRHIFYHSDYKLAEELISQASRRTLLPMSLKFDLSNYDGVVASLEEFKNQSGWLELSKVTINSIQNEEALVFTAFNQAGEVFDDERCKDLFKLSAQEQNVRETEPKETIAEHRQENIQKLLENIELRNVQYFDDEQEKLEHWAEDLKIGLEQEIKQFDKDIREAKKASKAAKKLEERIESQKLIKTLEDKRKRKRRELYDEQDRIDDQRQQLIDDMEQQLHLSHKIDLLFVIHWEIS